MEHDGRIVDDRCRSKTVFQRCSIEERLDVGARLAIGLSRAVELVVIETETTFQRTDGAVLRIQCHQCALHPGHLGQAQLAFCVRHYADNVTGVEYITRSLRRRAGPVNAAVGRGPLDAVPVQSAFAAVGAQQARIGVGYLQHQCRFQTGVCGMLAQGVELVLGVEGIDLDAGFGTAITVIVRVVQQAATQGSGGFVLHSAVDGGPDAVAVSVEVFAILRVQLLTHQLGNIGCIQLDITAVIAGGHRCRYGLGMLLGGDVTQFQHAAKDPVAALNGPAWVGDRVEGRRRFRQTCDHRQLCQAQRIDVLAVVGVGRRLDAVGAMPQVDLVDIQLHDLLLVQLLLDLQCQQNFDELALEGLLPGQEEVLRHLHGDGGAAALDAAGGGQLESGTAEALDVDAEMLEKAGIFGCLQRLDEIVGDLLKRNRRAFFLAELGNQFVVGGIYPQRRLEFDFTQALDVRQLGAEVVIDTGKGRKASKDADQRQCEKPFE